MSASPDLRTLLAILDDKGFGWLAGEILQEISTGRMVEREGKVSTDILGEIAGVVADDLSDDEPIERVAIAPEEQLGAAIALVRVRLVAPARSLAEAERAAGAIADRPPVQIAFVDREGVALDQGFERARPGDDTAAKELDELLREIVGDRIGDAI